MSKRPKSDPKTVQAVDQARRKVLVLQHKGGPRSVFAHRSRKQKKITLPRVRELNEQEEQPHG